MQAVMREWPKVIALCMMVPPPGSEGRKSQESAVYAQWAALQGGWNGVSYKPRKQALYRLAKPGEIDEGRAVDVMDRPGGQIEFVLHPDHTEEALCEEFARVNNHCVVHGLWRQRWTDDARLTRPAQGLRLAVLRWETVPPEMMPSGRLVVPVENDGWCVLLVDERYCTRELQYDTNDLLLRLAGDGLWIQMWFRRRPIPDAPTPDPLVVPQFGP